MIRPLATLAFAAAFLAAGALAPVAGVAESKTPLTGSDSRNVTVLEKNQPGRSGSHPAASFDAQTHEFHSFSGRMARRKWDRGAQAPA